MTMNFLRWSKKSRELAEIKRILMDIKENVARQDAVTEQMNTTLEIISGSVQGIVKDIGDLKFLLTKINTNPGPISPEDQELLNNSLNKTNAVSTKLNALKDALVSIDAETNENPNPIVIPPVEPDQKPKVPKTEPKK